MFIGRELKTKYGLLDAKTMIQKTQEVFDRLELHLDPAPWCGSWMRPTNRLWKFHAP
ncbi:hypothetical protein M5E87_04980 [Flavonifractor plautii]|nr:hypothetical protein M5E87_04980 [Flavonifractor plautii]